MNAENKAEFEAQVAETIRMFKVALHAVKAAHCDDEMVQQFVVESLKGDLQRVRATAALVRRAAEVANDLAQIEDENDDDFDDALRQIRDLPEAER